MDLPLGILHTKLLISKIVWFDSLLNSYELIQLREKLFSKLVNYITARHLNYC